MKRKGRTWFYRLVTTYLPIVYLLAFVLFFIFFMIISQLSQKQTLRANEAFTRYTQMQLDALMSNIDQTIMTQVLDSKVFNQYLFNMYEDDINPYLQRSEVSERFRQVKANFPLVHSINFYKNSDMSVLGLDLFLPFSSFGDSSFIGEEINKSIISEWTGLRSYKDFATSYETSVVSLVKKVPLLSDPQGILVVNLDAAMLDRWLKTTADGAISSIRLADQNGDQIAESKDPLRHGIMTVTSPVTGWTIESGIKETYHYAIFSDMYYSWIILGIVMVLAASIGIIYLSKRNARPVDASMARILEFLQGKQAGAASPELIPYVDAAVDRIIDFANRYQSESKSNLPYRQKHFFHELLIGERAIDNEELAEECRLFGIEGDWQAYAVALLEIDRMTDFAGGYSQRDQYLLKFVLTNVLSETAGEAGLHCWSEWLNNDRLGILFGASTQVSPEAVRDVSERIRAWVEANLSFTITIGIGGCTDYASGIRLSCEQADQALQFRSALGRNRVIDFTETALRAETELFDMLQLIRHLVASFKSGSDDWERQYHFLFTAIGKGLYAHDELKNLFNYLLYTFTRELSEFPQEYSEAWRVEGMAPIARAIDTFETVDELRQSIEDSLRRLSERWKQLRETRSQRQIIHDVKDFIEANYNNPELSLQLLSDKFNISKNYISRLFKDETGANFIDYLTELRMQHAKRLLEETNLSIQEIAAQVGYEHYFSFNRAFKKLTGFPPSDYRKGL
ncbi:helix-turn-helix domain-containing protein [Paenibacillus oryzisoli]|uniref:helix-turn-helix domain-containing protein n=1 Tax=Paenibacillus oryzisoli TaxID=1850517 RepID=UPI003D2C8811